jgi:hypothetical protein
MGASIGFSEAMTFSALPQSLNRYVCILFAICVSSRTTSLIFISVSPFFDFVSHVVCVRSDKNMLWIYTERVITLMACKHSFGDWPINKFVRKSVSRNILFSIPYDSVFIFRIASGGASPIPTVV